MNSTIERFKGASFVRECVSSVRETSSNTVTDGGGVRVAPADLDLDAVRSAGWDIEVLDGLDHTQAMQPTHVLPILKPWLENVVGV